MIMLLGDTHGNTKFVTSIVIPAAREKNVQWIYQVGDFGYWEHEYSGVEYLDEVSKYLAREGMHIVFIQGNHDKVSLIDKKYMQIDGFYKVRSNIWYAPNGTVWSPDEGKTNFIALGGAYSIDKQYRLDTEDSKRKVYGPDALGLYTTAFAETLWFPEEEMTDAELDDILDSVDVKVDIILAHDKPSRSNTPVELLGIRECLPNQHRLQKAVDVLKPKIFVHGHLHMRYTDLIRSGDDSFTIVEGLGADVSDFAESAWEFLDLGI